MAGGAYAAEVGEVICSAGLLVDDVVNFEAGPGADEG